MIYFYRPDNFIGSGTAFAVEVGGVEVAHLGAGFRVSKSVPPGPVTIGASPVPNVLNMGAQFLLMARPKMSVNAVEGQIHYVEVGTNVLVGGPELRLVGEAEATSAVAGLKPAGVLTGQSGPMEMVVYVQNWSDRALTVPPAANRMKLSFSGVSDKRADRKRIGNRTAAFGVQMGGVYFDRPVPDFFDDMIRTELTAAGHDLVEAGGVPAVDVAVTKFWFDTDTSPLHWDISGKIELDVTLRDKAGARSDRLTCQASERTYVWPSAEIFSGLVDRCLKDIASGFRRSTIWDVELAQAN